MPLINIKRKTVARNHILYRCLISNLKSILYHIHYSPCFLFSFNPDYTHGDENFLFKIFDEMKDHVYNEVIWFMTPFTWYTITKSLFVNSDGTTPAVLQNYKFELLRQYSFQFLAPVFHYFIYRDSRGYESISKELDNILGTALVSAIPIIGLDQYRNLLN